MINSMIHVAIKSYRRPKNVSTIDVFPFAKIYVPRSQYKEYRLKYGDKVIAIPDSSDGNLCRKSNAILDRSPCRWTLILDDDLTSIGMWEDGKKYKFDPDGVRWMIEMAFKLADACGVRLWGINQNHDPITYKHCTPFSFLGPILGPFNGHLDPELRYDESVKSKDDYDFWLQNIHKYHRTLRLNKYHYIHDHGKKPGGIVSIRTKAYEWEGIQRMKKKWGTKVFSVGGAHGASRDRKTNPDGNILNSMCRVPIAGV